MNTDITKQMEMVLYRTDALYEYRYYKTNGNGTVQNRR